jgi:hypothetical protein
MIKRAGRAGVALALALTVVATPIPANAAPNITLNYPNGSVTWSTSDFGVTEGSTTHTSPVSGSHGDAYDGAILLDICADASCTPTSGTYNRYSSVGTYDSSLQTYTGSNVSLSGLTVSAQMRFSTSIVAGRLYASLQNGTSSDVTRVIRIFSDLGSDGSTNLKYTSTNQTLSNQTMPVTGTTNYWSISSQDSTLTSTAQAGGDPILSYVFGTPSAAVAPNISLTNGQHFISYTVTIPANSTKSLLFVFGLGEVSNPANTHAGALNGLLTYLDTFSELPADLVSDLTSIQLSTIQNWVIAPSPSTFTSSQATPANTTSDISYSMTMSQAITGLTSSDFSNSGTATGCSFTPDSSTGTSFNIAVSGCSEGTLIPQLNANSITGTQSGPAVNSPASKTIIIDRTAPLIASVTTSNGNYSATLLPNLNLTVSFNESVTVTGTPHIPITIGTSIEYASFVSLTDSRTATFRFIVTVDYDNIDLDGITVASQLELNAGSISDLAVNSISNLTFTPPVTTSVYVHQPPSAPTIDSITANNTSLTIYFTPGANNGSSVSNYQYSINNGSTFSALSPTDAVSPITVTGLTNGTTYQIVIKAVSNLGVGLPSNMLSSAPTASATVNISLTASATTASKGTPITITAQVNQAGVVTFFWNGQRISGCIKKTATTSATCIWKPAVTGQWSINALLDPTDPTYVDSFSPKLSVFILRRSGTR